MIKPKSSIKVSSINKGTKARNNKNKMRKHIGKNISEVKKGPKRIIKFE